MKFLLRLYPRAWRARYEEEVARMLDDSGSGLREAPDLVRGALDAHVHPGPLGLPSRGVRGWFSLERSAGLAAIVAGSAWLVCYLALAVNDGRESQRTDVMRFVASSAVPGLLAAFAMGGLVARHVPRWRDRIVAATAVALVGGAAACMVTVLLINAVLPGVALLPDGSDAQMLATAVTVLAGTLLGVVAMWGRAPVARRWLVVLALTCLLDLVFLLVVDQQSFTMVERSAAGAELGMLVGIAWIGVGCSALVARLYGDELVGGSGPNMASVRLNGPTVLALAAAAIVLYLGIRAALGSQLASSLPTALFAVGVVALWLTPVALAWRVPGVAAARPGLMLGLVLVGLPAIALTLSGAIQPLVNLSGIGTEIGSLMQLVYAAGYVLVGRELLRLAPETRQRRGLLAVIAGLSVAPALAMAAVFHEMVNVVSVVVALALAIAVWAPVAATLRGSDPRRFWRPLAWVLPLTVIATVVNGIGAWSSLSLQTNHLWLPATWIAESAKLVIALLWLVAFGWRFPVARSTDQSVVTAAVTA